jgi:UDP-N-acetyl-D-glucosamine dehydrogenase
MSAPYSPEAARADAMAEAFVAKLASKSLTVGIVGLGYVGLPLAESFVNVGVNVLGFDIDQAKVDAVNNGRQLIKHISADRMERMRDSGLIRATSEPNDLTGTDAILICVPTPLSVNREPDLSYVVKTTESLAENLRAGQLIVLESTTYPGTSAEVMLPILENVSGLKAGQDFAIAYSPEREDPGNPDFHTASIPKVVGADTAAELSMAMALYGAITKPVPVSNLKTAEAVKLTENIFRLVNIALVNELKVTYAAMGIDIWEVIDAAKTKPFGFMAFYPGPGLGGHCIPIDPFYLTWKARAHGESTRFIELAGELVGRMPKHVIEVMAQAMSSKLQKAISGSRVLLMGLAYKKNVDDMRQSPSLALIEMLRERGAHVDFYDPLVPTVPYTRDHPELAGESSISFTVENLRRYDCVLISTDHDAVDYDLLVREVPLVVDTRNATRDVFDRYPGKIVKA